MEKKEMCVTTEDASGSSSLSGYNNGYPLLSNAFEFSEVEKSSLGFMELLGLQGYSSLLHLPSQQQVSTLKEPSALKDLSDTAQECSEVSNQQPATPNSSSISSASSGAVTVNEEQNRTSDQPEEHSKTKKLLKAKKTNQKRRSEPRFAFMTKSEVDHLEDGYRWRKYGQKAVKNSSFPRSYYRCTTASCNVKKRVERSFNDPSIVVTTYEGQHTHPSPVMPRSHLAGIDASLPAGVSAGCATSFGSLMAGNLLLSQYHHHPQQRQLVLNNSNSTLSPNNSNTDSTSKNAAFAFAHQDRRFCNSGTTAAFLRDHGLLQDIVPSHMLKEE
ncbi:hypothetical protein K1719_035464 [Acacia pycnantha]|nr:hypothetical protein K1719_035464 [Acacia pycnantha]